MGFARQTFVTEILAEEGFGQGSGEVKINRRKLLNIREDF